LCGYGEIQNFGVTAYMAI